MKVTFSCYPKRLQKTKESGYNVKGQAIFAWFFNFLIKILGIWEWNRKEDD